MPTPPPLTDQQKQVLRVLEPRLKACVATGDFEAGKEIAARIQKLLLRTGHRTRWMQNLNWLCECAIEAGEFAFAAQRLESVRSVMRDETRTHLEATALLAVALTRSGEMLRARRLVAEVLERVETIKSDRRRRQFHRRFIRRIEEECLLAGLRDPKPGASSLDVDRVQEEAIKLQVLSADEILVRLSEALPEGSIALLEGMREHAILQLRPADRKYLPSPAAAAAPKELGKKADRALKRIVWRAVCDPEDEIYQAWSQALSAVYDKKWIAGAIIAALKSWKITVAGLAISLIALAFKMGVRMFCDVFAPEPLMISLKDKL